MKKTLIRLRNIYRGEMTPIDTPITILYKPIIFTREMSFIYKPPITLCLFLVFLLPEDGPFGPKHVITPYIGNKNP